MACASQRVSGRAHVAARRRRRAIRGATEAAQVAGELLACRRAMPKTSTRGPIATEVVTAPLACTASRRAQSRLDGVEAGGVRGQPGPCAARNERHSQAARRVGKRHQGTQEVGDRDGGCKPAVVLLARGQVVIGGHQPKRRCAHTSPSPPAPPSPPSPLMLWPSESSCERSRHSTAAPPPEPGAGCRGPSSFVDGVGAGEAAKQHLSAWPESLVMQQQRHGVR